MPKKAKAIPTEQITMYFHEASRLPWSGGGPTKKVVMTVVASIATHSTPTLAARTASSMAATNAWTSTA